MAHLEGVVDEEDGLREERKATATDGEEDVRSNSGVEDGDLVDATGLLRLRFFSDLEADEALVRFPDPYVLGAAHIDGLDELLAPAMEVLSGSRWRRRKEGRKVAARR